MPHDEFPSMLGRRTETRVCEYCDEEFQTYADCDQNYCTVACVEEHRE